MQLNPTMLPELLLLNIIFAGASAFRAVLTANSNGIHITDASTSETLTVLALDKGSNSVAYDLKTGYIYGIAKNNQEHRYRIVRTRALESPLGYTCQTRNLEQWCSKRDGHCVKTCNSSNPYEPKAIVELTDCFKANNLVLDWVNEDIYWTCDPKSNKNGFLPSIRKASISGSLSEISTRREHQIKSLDIDPFKGELFFLELNNLYRTTVDGTQLAVYQFDEEVKNIAVDPKLKVIYVVGMESSTKEMFLARLDYGMLDYQKLYAVENPSWKIGPRVVNGVMYWISRPSDAHWRYVGNPGSNSELALEKITVTYEVDHWVLVDLDAQWPMEKGSTICSKHGCSDACSLSRWIRIECRCSSGNTTLGSDGKTCQVSPNLESTTQIVMISEKSTSSSSNKTEKTAQENGEVKIDKSVEHNKEAKDDSHNATNSGESPVAPHYPELTTSAVKSTVNGTGDFEESDVGSSGNATESETAGVVTASSSNMTLFYVVVTTIWVSIFVVVIVVKRRAKTGNYQPAGSNERRDFSL